MTGPWSTSCQDGYKTVLYKDIFLLIFPPFLWVESRFFCYNPDGFWTLNVSAPISWVVGLSVVPVLPGYARLPGLSLSVCFFFFEQITSHGGSFFEWNGLGGNAPSAFTSCIYLYIVVILTSSCSQHLHLQDDHGTAQEDVSGCFRIVLALSYVVTVF